MSYDPGQPQQPGYRQAEPFSPNFFSPPAQKPPHNIAMPRSRRIQSRQKKVSRRWPWIIVATICVLIIAAFFIIRYLGTLAGPTVTVDNYYEAVLQKNYSLAYSYLASNATLTSQNQKIPIGPQQDYTTSSQLLDSHIGSVIGYKVATTSNNSLLIINTIRSKNAHSIHYTVHFTMIQEDGTWKIKDMNGGF
jgi:hypothetical protein